MELNDLVSSPNKPTPFKKTFFCEHPECTKAFARRSDLLRHEKIHTNCRPFGCEYEGCDKTFIQRSALTVHVRVHTGEKPHACPQCHKAFSDSSSLARHRRIHSGKRPYACSIPGCFKTFCRKTTLVKHVDRVHTGSLNLSTTIERPSKKIKIRAVGQPRRKAAVTHLIKPMESLSTSIPTRAINSYSDFSHPYYPAGRDSFRGRTQTVKAAESAMSPVPESEPDEETHFKVESQDGSFDLSMHRSEEALPFQGSFEQSIVDEASMKEQWLANIVSKSPNGFENYQLGRSVHSEPTSPLAMQHHPHDPRYIITPSQHFGANGLGPAYPLAQPQTHPTYVIHHNGAYSRTRPVRSDASNHMDSRPPMQQAHSLPSAHSQTNPSLDYRFNMKTLSEREQLNSSPTCSSGSLSPRSFRSIENGQEDYSELPNTVRPHESDASVFLANPHRPKKSHLGNFNISEPRIAHLAGGLAPSRQCRGITGAIFVDSQSLAAFQKSVPKRFFNADMHGRRNQPKATSSCPVSSVMRESVSLPHYVSMAPSTIPIDEPQSRFGPPSDKSAIEHNNSYPNQETQSELTGIGQYI